MVCMVYKDPNFGVHGFPQRNIMYGGGCKSMERESCIEMCVYLHVFSIYLSQEYGFSSSSLNTSKARR